MDRHWHSLYGQKMVTQMGREPILVHSVWSKYGDTDEAWIDIGPVFIAKRWWHRWSVDRHWSILYDLNMVTQMGHGPILAHYIWPKYGDTDGALIDIGPVYMVKRWWHRWGMDRHLSRQCLCWYWSVLFVRLILRHYYRKCEYRI